jgi:hypothetical protein
VKYREDLSVIEYLAHPDERLRWQANALPADDLCVENAILLHRFNRYPLVIDPSGQAAEFLMNQFRDRKVYERIIILKKYCLNIVILNNFFLKNFHSRPHF